MSELIKATPEITQNQLAQNILVCQNINTNTQIEEPQAGNTNEPQCYCGEYLAKCCFPDCPEGVVEERPAVGNMAVCPKKQATVIYKLQEKLNELNTDVQNTYTIERNCYCGEPLSKCSYPDCDTGRQDRDTEPLPLDNTDVCPIEKVNTIYGLQEKLNKRL